jgi:hypothetical protein
MTLIELVKLVSAETGIPYNEAASKAQLVALINSAAQQIWDQTDLPNCLMEQVFTVDNADPLPRIALPTYCRELRGVRDRLGAIEVHDMRAKYATMPWPWDNGYRWRILGDRPLLRSIDNALELALVPGTYPAAMVITITGETATATRITRTLDYLGAGSAVGVNWTDVFSITKNVPTEIDVGLTAGGTVMSVIPNNESAAQYMLIELYEAPRQCSEPTYKGRCYEILFKPPFAPLINDGDSFQMSGYDQPIAYRATAIFRLRGLSEQATDAGIKVATVQQQRSEALLQQTIEGKIQNRRLPINFGPPRGDTRMLRRVRQWRYT